MVVGTAVVVGAAVVAGTAVVGGSVVGDVDGGVVAKEPVVGGAAVATGAIVVVGRQSVLAAAGSAPVARTAPTVARTATAATPARYRPKRHRIAPSITAIAAIEIITPALVPVAGSTSHEFIGPLHSVCDCGRDVGGHRADGRKGVAVSQPIG